MSFESQSHRSVAFGDVDSLISSDRLAAFRLAADGDDELVLKLYLWNRDLSVAFLRDIAILEVALRNAMHNAAARAWGEQWYASQLIVLDDRSVKQLNDAWSRLPKATRRRPDDSDVPGRVIAHCMFGFWTNLLDAGDYAGLPPRNIRVQYGELWIAFKHAFPGGREAARGRRALIEVEDLEPSARSELLRQTVFVRSWVHGICQNVNALRNRIAHHESLIAGVPVSGQRRRLTVEEAHEQCRLLARLIDRQLADWLAADTHVSDLLLRRPC